MVRKNSPDRVKRKIKHVAIATKMLETELMPILRSERSPGSRQIFAIILKDINKALEVTPDQSLKEIKEKPPYEIKHWSRLFQEDQDGTVPPHRVSDMKVNLQKDDKGKNKEIPWGLL